MRLNVLLSQRCVVPSLTLSPPLWLSACCHSSLIFTADAAAIVIVPDRRRHRRPVSHIFPLLLTHFPRPAARALSRCLEWKENAPKKLLLKRWFWQPLHFAYSQISYSCDHQNLSRTVPSSSSAAAASAHPTSFIRTACLSCLEIDGWVAFPD